MHIYVYIYIYIYICICKIHTCIYIYTHVYTHVYICTHVYMYIYTYIYTIPVVGVTVDVVVHEYTTSIQMYKHIYLYWNIYLYIYIYSCIHTHIYNTGYRCNGRRRGTRVLPAPMRRWRKTALISALTWLWKERDAGYEGISERKGARGIDSWEKKRAADMKIAVLYLHKNLVTNESCVNESLQVTRQNKEIYVRVCVCTHIYICIYMII